MTKKIETTEHLSPLKRLERDTVRVKEIFSVLMRYRLAGLLSTLNIQAFVDETAEEPTDPSEQSKEERIRLALTELGPTFIKAGQLLSTREDIVGIALAEELAKLQSDAPPDPPEVVATTIARELGRPVSEIFQEFEPEAFASASIAQVHKAMLWSGEVLAVKVQKRGAQEQIEADLSIMESLAQMAEEHSDHAKTWGVVRMVQEFRRVILNDLNFTRELRNIQTFEINFDEDFSVRFPTPWPELSSRRVLTMEFLDGILGTDIEALRESGEDLDAFAFRGANVYLKMIFRDGFYHADPHPGNLMLLRDGVLGIIDCGTVGRIDDALRDDLESLVESITQNDVEALTDTLWAQSKDQSDEAKIDLQTDVANLLENSEGSMKDVNFTVILVGMLQIFQKYKIAVRPGLTSLLRTLVELDGTARRLSPTFSLATVLQPYESEAIRRRLDPRWLMKKAKKGMFEWAEFLENLPKDLSTTLHKVRTGEFRVRLEHHSLNSIVNRVVLGILTASLILGSSLLWSSKAPPLINGVSALGALGFAAVLLLSWMLYKAIKESGEITPPD